MSRNSKNASCSFLKLRYPDSLKRRKNRLRRVDFWIRLGDMVRGVFPSPEDRADLIALARDGAAAHWANALVLLDAGWSCDAVALAFARWTTIRSADGMARSSRKASKGPKRFEAGGSAGQLSGAQQDKLKVWIGATLPRSPRQVGAYFETEFGVAYESRSN